MYAAFASQLLRPQIGFHAAPVKIQHA